MELLIGALVAGVLAAAFVRLRRGRADVLDYHDIDCPFLSASLNSTLVRRRGRPVTLLDG